MPWPLASHFSTMVQQPRLAFRDPRLQACRIERNSLNQPRVWAGQFAVVYEGVDPQGTAWAIRAFVRESSDRREHYDRISEYLKARPLRCLVDFEYRDAAIRATDGRWYPLVVMDWVEGLTLFEWVQSKCRAGKGPSIGKAAQHWLRLTGELSGAHIAHCDLQHANVLVTPGGYLKLVDYDGMCVPALAGRRNLETGLAPYQHPQRNEQTLLSSNLDHFSALVIYVALRALASDTSLWARYVGQSGYDKLLFRTSQHAQPLVLAVLVTDLEQQLQSEADPQKWLARVDGLLNEPDQIAIPQLGDRILKGSEPRQRYSGGRYATRPLRVTIVRCSHSAQRSDQGGPKPCERQGASCR